MGNPSLQLQLQNLINTSKTYLLFNYDIYRQQIKVLILIFIALISFKIGKSTVTDPLQKQIKQTKVILQTRRHYTDVLPKKIQSIKSKIILLVVIMIIEGLIYFVLGQFQPEILTKSIINYMILSGAACFLCSIFLGIYLLILKYKLKKGQFNDHYITQRLASIIKMLGPKTQSLLKIFLCKESVARYKPAQHGICSKSKCKQYRQLLKQKAGGIALFIENVLNFEWCSVCKKRLPFDQFVAYQKSLFIQKQGSDEDQLVNDRNNYLMNEIQRMTKWGKNLGPCNCSMRYWGESKKEIKLFKQRQKQIDQRLALFQNRQNLRR